MLKATACITAVFVGAIALALVISGDPVTAAANLFTHFYPLPTLLMAVVWSGLVFTAYRENRRWNNGVCSEHNEPWQHFDTDSGGARGYKCRDIYIWINHPFIDTVLA